MRRGKKREIKQGMIEKKDEGHDVERCSKMIERMMLKKGIKLREIEIKQGTERKMMMQKKRCWGKDEGNDAEMMTT